MRSIRSRLGEGTVHLPPFLVAASQVHFQGVAAAVAEGQNLVEGSAATTSGSRAHESAEHKEES